MLKLIELRKVIKILSDYDIQFDYASGGKHTGKFYKGGKSFPVKCYGRKTEMLTYALKGLIKKFNLPKDTFDG
jgi:hypothetical protein